MPGALSLCHQRRPQARDISVPATLTISLASEEVDLTVVLLPLFVFRADALDIGILLSCLPLHHAQKREVKEDDEI
jgi:hypothetical protein